MSEKPKLTSLEAALRGVRRDNALKTSAGSEPLISPVVSYKGHGLEFEVVFRELSEGYKQKIRYQAISDVERLRREHEEATGVEWRDADRAIEDLRTNMWDRMLLSEAMRNPEDPTQPAADWFWIEQKLPSEVVNYLMAKYREWETEISPDSITGAQIEEFVESLKKNSDDLTPLSLWQQHGSAILWASLLYMAGQLATSQTVSSTDGSSSETP